MLGDGEASEIDRDWDVVNGDGSGIGVGGTNGLSIIHNGVLFPNYIPKA